jgi:predicted O-methyltransferase YrrM
MIFRRTVNWLKYKLLSRHYKGHGIHSPFVFYIVATVMRNKTGADIVNRIEAVRKSNMADRRLMSVEDHGSGSLVMKSSLRSVSDICRLTTVPKKYGELLAALASGFGSAGIIELGTSLGISTMYLAAGAPSATVHTVEGCRQLAATAAENFGKARLGNISQHFGLFEHVFPALLAEFENAGLIYLDGNHSFEPTMSYFRLLAADNATERVLVLDDIYLNPEMEEAWRQIKEHPRVSITIDVHRMGIVFFRKGFTKAHYIIRY